MSSKLLTAQNISKSYRVRAPSDTPAQWVKGLFQPTFDVHPALSDVSLDLNEGECLAFLGPNGAGKSTLIKILCGIQKPDSGTVEVLGYQPSRRLTSFYRQVGVVFGHKSSLWWDLPLKRSLEMAQLVYGLSDSEFRPELNKLIEALGLQQVLDRPVRVLSLGERTKGELAMNLVFRPKVLFLDEPTLGLDMTSKQEIRNLLNDQRRERGLGIFLTSHDMGDIEGCANRVVLANKGKIHFEGSLDQVKRTFTGDVRIEAEASTTISSDLQSLKETFAQRSGLPLERIQINEQDLKIVIHCPRLQQGSTISAMMEQGLSNFHVTQPSLEEILLPHFQELRRNECVS